MSKVASGNWNDAPWRPVREGIKSVVFGMEADSMCCTMGEVCNGHATMPHTHPNEQIAVIIQGECDYYVDGTPYRMVPGSWVVVPSNVEHYIHAYDSSAPVLNLDIFVPDRPEYTEVYTKFVNELKEGCK